MEVEPGIPALTADQPKFKEIMYNLLSNAIKFTPEGGSVMVTTSLSQESVDGQPPVSMVQIAVSDTGIGIKPEDQARVFSEFEQVDSSYARQQQGTGLGLALTKRLVELHGGRIWVESEGVAGKGSTFTFVLPLMAQVVTENGAPAEETIDDAAPQDTGSAPRGSTILIVEDDLNAQNLLTHYLTEAGYTVTHALDGEQAIQMARDTNPDAITLDIMLPRKDGWEVLAELKSTPGKEDIPVVIVSMTEDRQLGFSLGAVEFLVKPVNKSRLIEVVNRAVATTGKQHATVLVVDDEPKTVEYLTDLLRHQGYSVLPAFGGQQAIDLATERLPDVIILDLMMPEVTGFDVVQRLREHPRACDIPILIFTAKDITDEDRRRLNSHIQAIMPKSGKEELLRQLEKLAKPKVNV
jgi:CheY-like chemotaxis protein/anti-sigma regulatory factor (Ser/Thr protein kinase)